MIDKHRPEMSPPAPPPQGATPSSLPDDVSIYIATLLEASDVCSLGSCSRAWRALCASDCIWIALARDRWPTLAARDTQLGEGSESSSMQGWRDFYISKHREVASCVSSVVNFIEQCSHNGSLEVGNHLKAIGVLSSMNLSFKDVQMFLLARKHGVLLNLIGLHYSLLVLRIPLIKNRSPTPLQPDRNPSPPPSAAIVPTTNTKYDGDWRITIARLSSSHLHPPFDGC